jgi:hypothetical protein
MIDALEQRDGVALARVLRDHLINKLTMFMQSGFVVEEQLLENAQ